MLHQVLHALETAQGPVRLDELSRALGIEPSALEGMIAYWVRKGRLKDASAAACSNGCGGACGGTASCAFVTKMPRTITLTPRDEPSATG